MELSEDERKLIQNLRKLEVSPKADTVEDTKRFISAMLITEGSDNGPQQPPVVNMNGATADGNSQGPQQWILQQNPRLSTFSGVDVKKEEATYELWRHEVSSLLSAKHSEDAVRDAIRRSLKGEAAHVHMRLGTEVTVMDILKKFDAVFGVVDAEEDAMAAFYSATQGLAESVTQWSCRVEDLLSKAARAGGIKRERQPEMLKRKFHAGLRVDLKEATTYQHHTITSYDEFVTAVRQAERDHPPKSVQHAASVQNPSQSTSENLTNRVASLEATLKTLTCKLDQALSSDRWQRSDGPVSGAGQHGETYGGGQQRRGRGGGRRQGGHRGGQQYTQNPWYDDQRDDDRPPSRDAANEDQPQNESRHGRQGDGDIQCRRCGNYGHIAVGCRVRLDHLRRPTLNTN